MLETMLQVIVSNKTYLAVTTTSLISQSLDNYLPTFVMKTSQYLLR